MKTSERLVVILSALMLLAVAATFIALAAWPAFSYQVGGFISGLAGTSRLWVLVAGTAVLLFAFYLLGLAGSPSRPRKPLIRGTSLGEIRITADTIEALAKRAARQIRGIKEVDTFADIGEDGVAIRLSILVSPDINIPATCDELQGALERYIRDTAGAEVTSIRVNVKSLAGEQKVRVE